LVKTFIDKSGQEVLEISWIHSSPTMLATHLSQELLYPTLNQSSQALFLSH
jgi:hypothetical protein